MTRALMEAAGATRSVLHPRAAAFTTPAREIERRIGLLFAVTGIALIAVMGVLGLIMRLTQATVIGLSPAWFYRLLTLHGVGMITGALLAMMGALWYVLHATVPLRPGRMLAAYALTVVGAACVLVATLSAASAPAGRSCRRFPSTRPGSGRSGRRACSSSATCSSARLLRLLRRRARADDDTLRRVARTLGWQFLRGREQEAPPPQAIAATVVAIDGLISCAVGSDDPGRPARAHLRPRGRLRRPRRQEPRLLLRPLDRQPVDLPGAPPRSTCSCPATPAARTRRARCSSPAGLGSLVFIATAYSHHLYMDFVQPTWAEIVSEIASYGALIPVAVITIYSMTMLIWGSRYRWTLASTLLYVGFAGWAIGGVGAVIDSLIPINFRLHNTTWVVAHFHTYLISDRRRLGTRVPRAPARTRRRAHLLARRPRLDGRR